MIRSPEPWGGYEATRVHHAFRQCCRHAATHSVSHRHLDVTVDPMNIAIIGGGVFGAMTAIRLAELDQTVSLFERLPGLMKGASSNANRLHQGFHYPRDEETARQCMRGFRMFQEEFESAVLEDVTNAYFIASAGSLTAPSDFLAFCSRIGLFYKTIDLDRCNPAVNNVALGVMTDEHVYDPVVLRRLMVGASAEVRRIDPCRKQRDRYRAGRYERV
jgi:hypothetical protein